MRHSGGMGKKLLLSVSEVAEVLSLSKSSIWRLVYKGDLKARRIGGRVLIPRTEVERLAGLEPNENPAGVGGEH